VKSFLNFRRRNPEETLGVVQQALDASNITPIKRQLSSWQQQALQTPQRHSENAIRINNINNNINHYKNRDFTSDLRNLLRKSEIPKNEDIDVSGPYDFRQLLRPAKHLPTESLRKRKGVLSVVGEAFSPGPTAVGNTPIKRRAHKY